MKIFVILNVMFLYQVEAQYKTVGIKTRYPASSASLVQSNSSQHQYDYEQIDSTHNGGHFSEPHTYDSRFSSQPQQVPTKAPLILDATADFINKTRSSMATGVCFKEVPTASLVRHHQNVIPAGNGSTPELSKIQVCCAGYERNPHIFTRCDPVCPGDCPNGICTAPNMCVCMPGHVRNERGKCITTCPLGCGNGYCNNDNECECKRGYTLELQEKKYCIPQCEPACVAGNCVAPNKCECKEGFRLAVNGACEPDCRRCENGKCTAPGVCTCNSGYTRAIDICEPVCDQTCENGFCVAPNTCACQPEFKLSEESPFKCLPHCDLPCLNGFCVAHNKCICNPGYVPDENVRNMCIPHCPQGCPNGYCTAPNLCICKPGFIKTGIKGRQTCTAV